MFAAPMTRHLPARPIERVQKLPLGRRRGMWRTLPQDELTFDAQKLGDAPALLVALGSPERFVDYREPFGSFIVPTQGVRNLGEKWSEKHAKRVLKDAGERSLSSGFPFNLSSKARAFWFTASVVQKALALLDKLKGKP